MTSSGRQVLSSAQKFIQAGKLLIGIRKVRGWGEQGPGLLCQPSASSSAQLLAGGKEEALSAGDVAQGTTFHPRVQVQGEAVGNLGFQVFAQEVWCSQVAVELLDEHEWGRLGVTIIPERDEPSAEHPPKAKHGWVDRANKDIPCPRSHG